MEHVEIDGLEFGYVETGEGPGTVVLSHSYLVDHRQFESQIEHLAESYRVIAYDHRDHGASGHASGSYNMDRLVRDGEQIIEALEAAPCHWVGLSTGGFVGMRLAVRRPDLLTSLVLMDTSGGREPPLTRIKNRGLLLGLRIAGVKPLMGAAMRAMFGPDFLHGPARAEERGLWRERIAANDPKALVRFGQAIFGRDDVLDHLRALDLPTLVVRGAKDRSIPASAAQELADAIPGAVLSEVPGAGHLCTIEEPDTVNEFLTRFLAESSSGPTGATTPSFGEFEAEGWESAADAYASSPVVTGLTGQAAKALVSEVGAAPGQRVLDLACGPGIASQEAREHGADVTGIDVAAAMVEMATRRVPDGEFRISAAESLPFPDTSFDGVVCGFGLPHFADPEAVFAEVFRVLRPGGQAAFTTWCAPDKVPFFGLVFTAVVEHGTLEVDIPQGPDMFRFAVEEEVIATMAPIGFAGISTTDLPLEAELHDSSEAMDLVTNATVRTRALFDAQDPSAQEAISASVADNVESMVEGGRLTVPMPAVLIKASRP